MRSQTQEATMKSTTLPSLWLATALLSSACTAEPDGSRQPGTSAAPEVVTLSATDGAFQAPDTIDAGWSTFRFSNRGTDIHYAHFVQLDSGRTVPDLVAAYAEAIRTSGPRPKWVTRFGGPGGAAPSDSATVTQHLEPGSYVLICPVEDPAGNPHFGKGEVRTLVVRPAGPNAQGPDAAPTPTVSIQLLDFAFTLEDSLTAGEHTIRVANAGAEPHDLVLLKLAPGTTAEQLVEAMNPERARRNGESAAPPPPFETLASIAGGIAVIRPGMEVFFTTTLSPGEYVILCMTTAPDGRSHIEHGMVRQVRVI